MFKKLKTMLFEEEVELEEEASMDFKPVEIEEKVIEQPVETEPVSMVSQPTVKRIDIDEQPVKIVKPTPAPIINRQQKLDDSNEYKPQAVISPMFGLTEAEMQKSVQFDTMIKKQSSKPPSDSSVISPMFGQVQAENKKDLLKRSRPPRKEQKVNLTLEEMLNIENQEEMEFTLFDVELDAKEFQSRENSNLINAEKPLEETDGLRIMKGKE